MKKKWNAHIFTAMLLMSFLLGIHEGRLAMWKDNEPEPCKLFPYPVLMLPKTVQQQLKTGIRLETIEDLNTLLENFLS